MYVYHSRIVIDREGKHIVVLDSNMTLRYITVMD